MVFLTAARKPRLGGTARIRYSSATFSNSCVAQRGEKVKYRIELSAGRRDGAATPSPAIPRRAFLAGLAALSAGTLLPGCATESAGPAAVGGKPYRIDTHHHHIPPNYLASIPRARGGGKPPVWTPAR